MNTTKETATKKGEVINKQRSYNEVIQWLDSNWHLKRSKEQLAAIKHLDQALGSPSKETNIILITGTNGKGLTIHFATQLLQEEGLNAGAFYSPHILSYSERISINNESITNKTFTELANDILNAADQLGIAPHAIDVLTMMALVHFKNSNIDLGLLEITENISWHPLLMCTPKITAITRVSTDERNVPNAELETSIQEMLSFVKPKTWVISAEQSKLNLQYMQNEVNERKGNWMMPTRKLAPLAYPFEQLHGRSAALAERISQTYIDNFITKDASFVNNSLLVKPKGQRGRPTTEAKRQQELNPRRTSEQFWKETKNYLPARFQLLEREKPTILLDNASNIDAFNNLLLGIRLLHYRHPLKGLALIVGCPDHTMDIEEFLKSVRYFFKKTSGQLILCPIRQTVAEEAAYPSWNAESLINDVKGFKIKARSAKSFDEAFEMAKKMVDERHGLIAISGSHAIIKEYWDYRGIKKLS